MISYPLVFYSSKPKTYLKEHTLNDALLHPKLDGVLTGQVVQGLDRHDHLADRQEGDEVTREAGETDHDEEPVEGAQRPR